MTLQEIIDKNIKNGRFFAIEAETEKKRKGIVYRKHSYLTAQFGGDYENVAAVKAMGEREHTRDELIAMGAIKDEPSEKPLTLVYALESIVSITYKENGKKEAMAAV